MKSILIGAWSFGKVDFFAFISCIRWMLLWKIENSPFLIEDQHRQSADSNAVFMFFCFQKLFFLAQENKQNKSKIKANLLHESNQNLILELHIEKLTSHILNVDTHRQLAVLVVAAPHNSPLKHNILVRIRMVSVKSEKFPKN
jgi:hypothetical protein